MVVNKYLQHTWESIKTASDKIREIIGEVDNVVVLDKELDSVITENHSDLFDREVTVSLHLTDYPHDKNHDSHKRVQVTRVLTKGTNPQKLVLIQDTLTYQVHVPYQSIMLPIRAVLLGCDAKNIVVCPKIWSFNETAKAGDLFVVNDHANLSAHTPGIGPNLNE